MTREELTDGVIVRHVKNGVNYRVKEYKQGYNDAVCRACEWFGDYLMELGCPDDWMRDSQAQLSGEEIFRRFMLDHI